MLRQSMRKASYKCALTYICYFLLLSTSQAQSAVLSDSFEEKPFLLKLAIGLAGQFLLFHTKDDRVIDYYYSEKYMNQTYSSMGISPDFSIDIAGIVSVSYAPTFRYGYLKEEYYNHKLKTFYHDHHFAVLNKLKDNYQLGFGVSMVNTGKGFSGTILEFYADGTNYLDEYMDLQFVAYSFIFRSSLWMDRIDYELKAMLVPDGGISFIPAVKKSFIMGFGLRYPLFQKTNSRHPVLY